MRRLVILLLGLGASLNSYSWGFYGHKMINYYAVFLLPPEMLVFYKKHLGFLSEHAVDPDKRRYAVADEGPRHYIDMDQYAARGQPPESWQEAVNLLGEDTLKAHGIVPWWSETMLQRLTNAFRKKDSRNILKLSAELGHYIADAHVPLHACSNHNGQFTGQQGIHGFWESRIPEMLAGSDWDLVIGHAIYIPDSRKYIWARVRESAASSDSVLSIERRLSASFPADKKYAFENRNGKLVRQYSARYTRAYSSRLGDMVERRFRQSIFAVAAFWYTAWANAGQPALSSMEDGTATAEDSVEYAELNRRWKADAIRGRPCE